VKTISFQVNDKTYERLNRLRGGATWRQFWMLCAIRHCQKILYGLEGSLKRAGRFGVETYQRDIKQFQQEC